MTDFNPLVRTEPIAHFADMADEYEMQWQAEERARYIAEQFAEYICSRASTVLYRPQMTTDVVADVLQTLGRKGCRVDDSTREERATMLVTPMRFEELKDSTDHWVRERVGGVDTLDSIGYYGIQCTADPSLPEDTAVCVHQQATARNPRLDDWQPWLVRDSNGIVTVRLHE